MYDLDESHTMYALTHWFFGIPRNEPGRSLDVVHGTANFCPLILRVGPRRAHCVKPVWVCTRTELEVRRGNEGTTTHSPMSIRLGRSVGLGSLSCAPSGTPEVSRRYRTYTTTRQIDAHICLPSRSRSKPYLTQNTGHPTRREMD